jgi:phosphate transport system substrate-binding protein
LDGSIDIVDASRAAKPEEESAATAKGLDWVRFTVGYDGLTVAVNPSNTFVESMTTEQLAKLYEPGSTVSRWKDLDPAWPDRKIVLFSPDNDSGTYDYFVEAILPKKKAQRQDLQSSADDNTLVTGVAGDKDSIGYFGYAYYQASRDKLKAVAIKESAGSEGVLPSLETVISGKYKPLSRPLYIYVKRSSLKRTEVMEFVRYYLANAGSLSQKAGYIPPTDSDTAANDRALNEAVEGAAGGSPS